MVSFTLGDQMQTLEKAAQALAASGLFTEPVAHAVLREFCLGLAVSLEVEGQAWTTEEGTALLQDHVRAKGLGEGLKLWAALLRVAGGRRKGVPEIMLRPLVLDVLLCCCPAAIRGELPRSIELDGGGTPPDFTDIVKDVWRD